MTDTPVEGGHPEEPPRTRFADPAPELPDVPPPLPAAPAPVPPPPPPPPVELPPEPVPPPVELPADAPEPVAPGGGGVTRLLAALAVLLLVAIGGLGWWLGSLWERPDTDYQRTAGAALAAAKRDAALVLAYDYRSLEAGFQKALKVTTDADGKDCPQKADRTSKSYDPKANCFRSEFSLTHRKVVTDLATRYKVVVIAEVGAAGVERVDGDRVTVLLYVNQQSTSTQSASPKITQDRVEMIMQQVRGKWLVAGINAL